MKIYNKQTLKNGTEYFHLPAHSGIGHNATWEKTDEGLILRNLKIEIKIGGK